MELSARGEWGDVGEQWSVECRAGIGGTAGFVSASLRQSDCAQTRCLSGNCKCTSSRIESRSRLA